MILLDANILIYAINKDASLNKRAKVWLEHTLNGPETVGLAWTVILAFLRLTTRPGIFRAPLSLHEALDLMDSWLNEPAVTLVQAGPRHFSILRELLQLVGTGGNLTSDAHLAALAIEYGAEICSSDGDFARFPHLKWRNPFA